MASESPVILVDLDYCYLPFDHMVRHLMRKLAWSEKQRQRGKEGRRLAAARAAAGRAPAAGLGETGKEG